jgi:hypothetical protein
MATKKPKSKVRSIQKSSKKKKASKVTKWKPKPIQKKKKAAGKPKPLKRAQKGRANTGELVSYETRERRASSGGQSGDTQGIAVNPDVDSESVEQLLEEGQAYEAEVISGVENAPDPDQSEVHTREVPEDDVPEEYREKD